MNDIKLYSFIGITKKSGNLITGYNNCIIDIKNSKCKLVIIAQDASDNTIKKFSDMCKYRNIPFMIYGTKDNLGLSLGKAEISVLAIKDEAMAKVVLSMFE